MLSKDFKEFVALLPVIDLDNLIRNKLAAARPKDLLDVATLKAAAQRKR